MPYARHVFHVYALRLAHRAEVQKALTAAGVANAVYYPIALHMLKAHRDLGYHAGEFPVAEQMCHEELSLPVYPELSEAQIEYIAGVVREAAFEAQEADGVFAAQPRI
jgi:dTDP-4-amino-4,6-dideoxygalactose transaminase